jgi:hypothetical protein
MAGKSVKNKRVLVTDKKYEGKYVAFNPAKGKKIIASGLDPGVVIRKARRMGVRVPAIVFVPRQDLAYIY